MQPIVTAQGGLVKVKLPATSKLKPVGARRKRITRYSRASRKRMLDMFASMNITRRHKVAFITLTFGENYPDAMQAKEYLWAFWMRLKRFKPNLCGVWRLEPQEREAPHFHLLLINWKFIPHDRIAEVWRDVIGIERAANFDSAGYEYIPGEQSEYPDGIINDFPQTSIELLKGKKAAMNYVSKYVAKVAVKDDEQSESLCFNDVAYLDERSESTASPEPTVGRFWGIFNKHLMPFADKTEWKPKVNEKAFNRWVYAASMKYGNVGKSDDGKFKFKEQGFTLYVENALNWLHYFMVANIESWDFDYQSPPRTALTAN